MIYKKVAKIEEKISAIGIGCWNMGGDWDSSEEKTSIDIPFCFQLLIELLHDLVGVGDGDPQFLCHVLDFHKVVFVQ